mgnify:CR=1 FL=1
MPKVKSDISFLILTICYTLVLTPFLFMNAPVMAVYLENKSIELSNKLKYAEREYPVKEEFNVDNTIKPVVEYVKEYIPKRSEYKETFYIHNFFTGDNK